MYKLLCIGCRVQDIVKMAVVCRLLCIDCRDQAVEFRQPCINCHIQAIVDNKLLCTEQGVVQIGVHKM